MKRKIMGALLMIMLLCAALVFPAAGEEADMINAGIVIFPYTTDVYATSAQATASAIASVSGTGNVLLQRYGSAETETNFSPRTLSTLCKKESVRYKQKIQSKITDCDEIYLIIPRSDGVQLESTGSLYDQLAEYIKQEKKLHFILIGDENVSASSSSMIGRLMRTDPELVDVLYLRNDFTKTSTQNPNLHTGDWFIASRFGTPVDLRFEKNEEEGYAEFTLPTDGTITAICRQKGLTEETLSINAGISTSYLISGDRDANLCYACLHTESLTHGKQKIYTRHLDSLKLYYYPDMTTLEPALVAYAKEGWLSGEYDVSLYTPPFERTPDAYFVNMRRMYTAGGNDNESALTNLDIDQADYLFDGKMVTCNRWTAKTSLPQNTRTFAFSADVSLKADDGNLIWTWNTSAQNPLAKDEVISAKRPYPVTIYYTDGFPGRTSMKMDEIFEYNHEYSPDFFINGIPVSDLQEGLTLAQGVTVSSVSPGNNLIISVDGTAADGTVTMEPGIKFGDVEMKADVEITVISANTMLEDMSFEVQLNDEAVSDAFASAVSCKVLDTVQMTACLPSQLESIWEEMRATMPELGSVNDLIFHIDTEKMNGILIPSNALLNDDQHLTAQEDGSLTAAASFRIASGLKNTALCVPLSITTGAGSTLQSRELQLEITNRSPVLARKGPDEPLELKIEGLPGRYQKIEDILTQALGTNQFQYLFDDEETPDQLNYRVMFDDDSAFEFARPQDPTYDAGEAACIINLLTDGEHTITLIASDESGQSVSMDIALNCKATFYDKAKIFGACALLVLLVLALILHQVFKPSFKNMAVKCVSYTKANRNIEAELLKNAAEIELKLFKKKPVTLLQLMTMAHQPPVPEFAKALGDVLIYPARRQNIKVKYKKNARKALARVDKKTNTRIQIDVGNGTVVVTTSSSNY